MFGFIQSVEDLIWLTNETNNVLSQDIAQLSWTAYWPILKARYDAHIAYLQRFDPIFIGPEVFEVGIAMAVFCQLSLGFFGLIALTLYLLTTGARVLADSVAGRDSLFSIFAFLDDCEEELGSFEDVLYYIFVFAIAIIWFYFITLVSAYIGSRNLIYILSLFTLVLVIGIIVPISVLSNLGVYFTQYVRGAGRTSNIFFETLLDFVSVSVIMIRFLIQNIRFVFIFFAFFELYEFVYTHLDGLFRQFFLTTMSWADLQTIKYLSWVNSQFFAHMILQWVLYLYYLGHLTVLFIVQLSIYFALSFWLFFFLYTTFISQAGENYFLLKRVC